MTDNNDRASIYAAMAAFDEEEQEERAKNNPFARHRQMQATQSVKVTVDGQTCDVATHAYVRELERTIKAQAAKIEKFERQFHRIAAAMKNQRVNMHGQTNRINDAFRELDQKIDRRD